MGKVKYKPKKKKKKLDKLASGANLYSAMGTTEIKTRKYDPTGAGNFHDTKDDDKIMYTPQLKASLVPHFKLCSRNYGDIADDDTSTVPALKILEIFETAKYPMSKFLEIFETAKYP